MNKYKNPILLLLIKFDVLMYNIIIYYNTKMLNLIIFVNYLLFINPIKIFYYKIYKVLYI